MFNIFRKPSAQNIEFGRAKHFDKITLEDCLKYPVWTSAHDERHDEEYLKPVKNCSEVTKTIISHPLIVPIITFKIKETDIYGTGSYLHDLGEIFGISIWCDGQWNLISNIPELSAPLTFISVPKILGVEDVEFTCQNLADKGYRNS